jgi:hypothetical protein
MSTLNSKHRITSPLKNLPRPAAFIRAKHIILNSKTATDIKEAEKTIDRYVFLICEKPLREQHRLDLLYILDWKISKLQKAGLPIPSRIGQSFEDPILNAYHKRLEAK